MSDSIDYSIAIPAYGRPERVRETLTAALAQRFPSDMRWEILVNDDGSNPPLSAVLAEFEGKVRFLRNPQNLGWPQNWNATLKLARGQWVHMLHSDDLVDPDFAPAMWAVIKQHRNAVLVHSLLNSIVMDRPVLAQLYTRLRGLKKPSDNPNAQIEVHKMGIEAARHALRGVRATTAVVRREVASSIVMRPDLKNPSDEEYFVHLGLLGDVVFYPRRLITYRYHNEQDSQPSWTHADFLDKYLRVHEASLSLLGDQATEEDKAAAHYRVANAASKVIVALALAGDIESAHTVMRRAIGLAPNITASTEFKKARFLTVNPFARWWYKNFM